MAPADGAGLGRSMVGGEVLGAHLIGDLDHEVAQLRRVEHLHPGAEAEQHPDRAAQVVTSARISTRSPPSSAAITGSPARTSPRLRRTRSTWARVTDRATW